jgi:hypothetical protein
LTTIRKVVNREFKFDNAWLKNPKFIKMVGEIWVKHVNSWDPIDVFNIKLKRVKKHLKGWGVNLFGNNKKREMELRSE